MITYRTAMPSERQAYLTLANDVFTQATRPHDFATLLPKVYGPQADSDHLNYLAVDDQKGIRGVIATLPGKMHVGDTVLATGYIGTVSVHPDARGEGHMKKLMQLNMNRMVENGTHIALLGGQRQRYSYFGYEPAGVRMTACVSARAVHHALSQTDICGIVFEEILPGSRQEAQAAALHSSQRLYVERDFCGFVTAARSYGHTPYAAVKEERLLGYVICGQSPDAAVEVLAASLEDFDAVIKAWMAQHQLINFSFPLPGWDLSLVEHVWDYAEGMQTGTCVQADILLYAPVVEAFLRLKSQYLPLADGQLALEADGQAFTITVKDGQIQVSTGAQNPLRLCHRDMQRLLLDPFEIRKQILAPRGWFPLPLYVSVPDEF